MVADNVPEANIKDAESPVLSTGYVITSTSSVNLFNRNPQT